MAAIFAHKVENFLAIGLVFVLSAGEIDLSIGSIVAVSALAAAVTINAYGMLAGIAVGLGAGLAIGLVAGGGPTTLYAASFVSMDADGFTVNFSTTNSNGRVRWIAHR